MLKSDEQFHLWNKFCAFTKKKQKKTSVCFWIWDGKAQQVWSNEPSCKQIKVLWVWTRISINVWCQASVLLWSWTGSTWWFWAHSVSSKQSLLNFSCSVTKPHRGDRYNQQVKSKHARRKVDFKLKRIKNKIKSLFFLHLKNRKLTTSDSQEVTAGCCGPDLKTNK